MRNMDEDNAKAMEPMSDHRYGPPEDFQTKARSTVVKYFNRNVIRGSDPQIFFEDTYVVWFCKTLQNWKALISTTMLDNTYYEVTYNGDQDVIYLDVYVKAENVTV